MSLHESGAPVRGRAALLALVPSLLAVLLGACSDKPEPAPPLPPVMPASLDGFEPDVKAILTERAEAVRKSPGDPLVRGGLCIALEANGLPHEAATCYDQVADALPADPWWRFHEALSHRAAGETDTALAMARELATAHPDQAPMQGLLGTWLLEGGDLDGAERAFRKTAELAPGAAPGYQGLAEVYLLREEFEKARVEAEKAIQVTPASLRGKFLLGEALRGLGRTDEAAPLLAEGQGAPRVGLPDPLSQQVADSQRGLNARARRLESMAKAGQFAEAEATVKEALSANPNDTRIRQDAAALAIRMNDPQKALDALLPALAIERDVPTLMKVATCYAMLGKNDEALKHAEEALALDPEEPQANYVKSMVLASRGEKLAALPFLERAARNAPNPRVHVQLGELRALDGNLEGARLAFQRAVELAPEQPQGHVMLAEACLRLGRLDEAVAATDAAERLAPGSEAVRGLREKLREQGR